MIYSPDQDEWKELTPPRPEPGEPSEPDDGWEE